jgi:hypothetical protein
MSQDDIQPTEDAPAAEATPAAPESGELDTAQAVEQAPKEAAPSDNGDSPDGDDDATAKPNKGVQKRIGELTHNWRDAQRERDYWRDMALKGSQKPEPEKVPTQPESQAEPPPTLESMDFDETKYQQAMTKWVQGNIEQGFAQRDAQAQQLKQQETLQQRFQSFSEKAKTFSASTPDYDAIANNPDLPVSDTVRDIVLGSEKGPELLYHLGRNVAEADRISRLDPTSAALEIGRLEARMTLQQPAKTTNAPDPIKPVGGGGSAIPATEPNIDAWMEQRNKQLNG